MIIMLISVKRHQKHQGNVTITAMVESTDQEIDSEWLGTFTDSGRLEISYRELSLSVQWSGHIATFTWTLKR